ncbi:MAG: PqqD family protein [Bacteroidales bacterium]|nr:PqqD family protein [Bacteroidales bacterium]
MIQKFKKLRWLKKQNMLDLVPVRKASFEKRNEKMISIQVKRFPFINLARLLGKSEYVYVHLDEKGSQIWILIDGRRTVAQICEQIKQNSLFQQDEMLEERIAFFIKSLYQSQFIDFIYNE